MSAATQSPPSNVKAVYLSSEDLKLACSLLYQAYHDDPLFCEIFDAREDGYEMRLRAAIREELNVFWQAKQPMIGLFDGEHLLAVACLTLPVGELGPRRFWHWRLKMLLTAGYLGTKQMLEKEQLIHQHMPDADYHMIAFIGVHPDHQAHGLGHMLLGAIESFAAEQSNSEGVGVYVTLEKYLSFFKDGAFEHVKSLTVAGIEGQLMYWKKPQ